MAKVIGIDLGTTNSCVAVMDGKEPKVIENEEGNRTTPSVVTIDEKGERTVGTLAKRQAVTKPKDTIFSIKRLMGRKYSEIDSERELVSYEIKKGKGGNVAVEIQGKEYTPQEISAMTLAKIKSTVEDKLGEEVKQAVITVPAYFNDSQRQATKDAGTIAGLEVLRIINEPTAASLAYGLDKKKNEKIAVYDLGGGTFDVSVLEIGDGVFEVKSTNGDTHLGGDDFDQRIIDWIISEFNKDQGIDLAKDQLVLQRLKEAAEKAKCELSTRKETEINLPFITADDNGPKHLNMKLTRSGYEKMIEDLVERTQGPCERAMKDAGILASDIDEVVLVGGMTRTPLVIKTVKEIFGKEPHKGVNPDEVVAVGAAIQAGVLAGDVKDIVLLDVTPLSLGIETLGGVFTRLIERNTTIPTKKSQVFSTAENNQPTVDVHVLQGEREMAATNKTIGRFQLNGIPPAPRGLPQIEVSFDIDANGILSVSAKDKATGKEQSIKIQASSGLSEEEIDEMVKDGEKHKEEDEQKRKAVDARNGLDQLIHSIEKTVSDTGDKLDDKDKKEVEAALKQAKQELDSDDEARIKKATDELNKSWGAVAEKMYKAAGAGDAAAAQAAGAAGAGAAEEPAKAKKKGKGKKADAEVVDAEYEVEEEDDKKAKQKKKKK